MVGGNLSRPGTALRLNLDVEQSWNDNYLLPLANFSVALGHNLAWKAGWNYYQYKEKSFVGPTDGRYFHANNATLSLRWAL